MNHDFISDEIINNLTEDEAINLIIAIEQKFGFAGTTFNRADAETEWQAQTRSDENGDEINDQPMPDEVWERVQQTWEWRKGINEMLTEHGWELVYLAVADAIKEDEAR